MVLDLKLGTVLYSERFCVPPNSADSDRATILRISTNNVMINAPDHAKSCQSLYGLIAYVKMTDGKFAIGLSNLVLQN
jgi:hypothetical protein